MNKTVVYTSLAVEQYTEKEVLFALLAAAAEQSYSYAFWKLPNETNFHLVVDFSEALEKRNAPLETKEQGFVLHPFITSEDKSSYFIRASVLYSASSKLIQLSSSESTEKSDAYFELVTKKLQSKETYFPITQESQVARQPSEKGQYISLVEKAKVAIAENRFKKIVLARNKSVAVAPNLDVRKVVFELIKEYSNAFVSLVSTKELGTWLTASPENLVSTKRDGTFTTMALAGTQQINEGEMLPKAVWTQKEIEEQALVSRYIVNCFKKIRLREYDEDGPKTVRSGNLMHLRTDFTVNTFEVNFPELGSVMLELLHPTSAVCGMPKDITLSFLTVYENLSRELFTGYFGPVNIEGESHIYVNLRCAKLYKDTALLYAGAGITQDSEPEKEWRETELKMEAVGRFLVS